MNGSLADEFLCYSLYRGNNNLNDLIRFILEETKNYVFEGDGIVLESCGYHKDPLSGQTLLGNNRYDMWKIIDVLFKLSERFEGLVFQVTCNNTDKSPFYIESMKNDVIPTWINNSKDFSSSVYGYSGVIHVLSPEMKKNYKGVQSDDLIRKLSRETRNILITEAIKQKLIRSSNHGFGMQRMSVTLPEDLAFIARQRPDILSTSINEFSEYTGDTKSYETRLESMKRVMVHVMLNYKDAKVVTAVADIESPQDIVSHRISLAMLKFDEKYSSFQNGALEEPDGMFKNANDAFERERLTALYAALNGKPQSMAHKYQMAKTLCTEKHRAECRKLFTEGNTSSDKESPNSGEDDEYRGMEQRKQVYKKKKSDFGKKKTLAVLKPKSSVPEVPLALIEELPAPTSSNLLRNFERAVNGDDVYKESSDEGSLGEEEDMDLFVAKAKPKSARSETKKNVLSATENTASDEEEMLAVADLIHGIPPLANTDDFEDFDI